MSSFGDLPILFVDDYGELSEEYLEHSWEEMSGRSYDLTKLTRSHYLRHFESSVSSLTSPRFICWRSSTWPGERFARALEASRHPLPELPSDLSCEANG